MINTHNCAKRHTMQALQIHLHLTKKSISEHRIIMKYQMSDTLFSNHYSERYKLFATSSLPVIFQPCPEIFNFRHVRKIY